MSSTAARPTTDATLGSAARPVRRARRADALGTPGAVLAVVAGQVRIPLRPWEIAAVPSTWCPPGRLPPAGAARRGQAIEEQPSGEWGHSTGGLAGGQPHRAWTTRDVVLEPPRAAAVPPDDAVVQDPPAGCSKPHERATPPRRRRRSRHRGGPRRARRPLALTAVRPSRTRPDDVAALGEHPRRRRARAGRQSPAGGSRCRRPGSPSGPQASHQASGAPQVGTCDHDECHTSATGGRPAHRQQPRAVRRRAGG